MDMDMEPKVVKTKLAKIDIKWMADFRKQYPGWDVVRYTDNSLEFIPPKKD